MLRGMLPWRDDLSTSTLEEVLRYQIENRAWSKELRFRSAALVNSRLANEISQEDYLASRKLTREETADLVAYADKHGFANFCRLILNSNEFMFIN